MDGAGVANNAADPGGDSLIGVGDEKAMEAIGSSLGDALGADEEEQEVA